MLDWVSEVKIDIRLVILRPFSEQNRTEQNFIDIKLKPHTGGVRAQRSIQTVIYRHAELNNTRNNTSNVMNFFNSISVISGRSDGGNEKLCTQQLRLRSKRFQSASGIEPANARMDSAEKLQRRAQVNVKRTSPQTELDITIHYRVAKMQRRVQSSVRKY